MVREQNITRCIDTAVEAGSPMDQVKQFIECSYIPYEWQWRFHSACREADRADGPVDIGLGGARGPGKSHAVLSQAALDDCQRVKGLKVLFLRQTGQSAKESFDDLVAKTLLGHIVYWKTQNSLRFENGSRIILGGFKDERDIDKYIGIEYDLIIVEELTQLTQAKYEKLRGSLRTSKPNWRPRMYTSFNPGGIGHTWVKERYVIPFRLGEQNITRFVPSTYKDNPALNKEYIEYLEGLQGDLGRAWREGDWDLFEGQYFAEWRRDKHVCEPFEVPDTWPKFRSIDPSGRSGITSCHWYAVDRDARVWVYKEHYCTGMDMDEHAEQIKKMSFDREGNAERYQYTVMDSAAWAKAGYAETGIEIYMRHGVGVDEQLIASDKHRLVGWNVVHQYLRIDKPTVDNPNPQPKLKVFKTCYNMIRTIPELRHDELHPEDVDSKGEDHCLTGDTLVDTNKGQKMIKDLVGKDGRVATLVGWKNYRSVRMTAQQQEIFKVTLGDGRSFKATADHNVLTDKGWKQVKTLDLVHDSVICLDTWKNPLSFQEQSKSLKESDTIFAGNTSKGKDADFMFGYGRALMEKWREDIMSIIRITTDQTTVLEIWKNYLGSPTSPFMQSYQRIVEHLRNASLNTQYQKQEHGTPQQLDQNGIVNTQKKVGNTGNNIQKDAKNVREDTQPIFQADRSSAILIAKCEPCGKEDVYNLTVPSVKHFSINGGIIVHNCGDELRYFLQTLREGRAAKQENAIEKRMRQAQEQETSYNFNYTRN